MERLRGPEFNQEDLPFFYCTSLVDMMDSRDEMFELAMEYEKTESRGVVGFLNKSRHLLYRFQESLYGNADFGADAVILIESLTHDPDEDRTFEGLEKNQVVIADNSHLFPIYLPGMIDMKIMNITRQREGLPPISIDLIKGSPWKADIQVGAAYSTYRSDRYSISRLQNLNIVVPTTVTVPGNIVFSAT